MKEEERENGEVMKEKEWIGGNLERDGGWKSNKIVREKEGNLIRKLFKRRIVRVDGKWEEGIVLSILMEEIKRGIERKRKKILEWMENGGGSEIEKKKEEKWEKSVEGEEEFRIRKVIGNKKRSMEGSGNEIKIEKKEGKLVEEIKSEVDEGDFWILGIRKDNDEEEILFKRLIELEMIEMVMGGEDEIESKEEKLKWRLDGIGVGRIDGGCKRDLGIMDKKEVIIDEEDEMLDLKNLLNNVNGDN